MLVAGYLHDLGKVAVPNAILNKPGKLDPEEFDVIRAHTYHTYHILSTIGGFEEIAIWAAFHHERLDGKGYPFHVRGEDIPFRVLGFRASKNRGRSLSFSGMNATAGSTTE